MQKENVDYTKKNNVFSTEIKFIAQIKAKKPFFFDK
jgi:hypothetical protein